MLQSQAQVVRKGERKACPVIHEQKLGGSNEEMLSFVIGDKFERTASQNEVK